MVWEDVCAGATACGGFFIACFCLCFNMLNLKKGDETGINGYLAKGTRSGDKKLQKTAFLQNWGQTGVKTGVVFLLIDREAKLK
ncbi:hypothetical protein [Tannerella forsythia]|uniref:Uncharacterized protein n=1 Tax=Tannerella forsythia TaxID=28112 RepID=A0A3P1YVX4_TANFO|nr:hypothetical protein [Tannerella forsythia]RRD75214.1 hypothetical protein EII41_06790 [Tannerella forsythia]